MVKNRKCNQEIFIFNLASYLHRVNGKYKAGINGGFVFRKLRRNYVNRVKYLKSRQNNFIDKTTVHLQLLVF